jgi:hypothetical protein
MFINDIFMCTNAIFWTEIFSWRPPASDHTKRFQLDSIKIKRAHKVLRADTETEAIERMGPHKAELFHQRFPIARWMDWSGS